MEPRRTSGSRSPTLMGKSIPESYHGPRAESTPRADHKLFANPLYILIPAASSKQADGRRLHGNADPSGPGGVCPVPRSHFERGACSPRKRPGGGSPAGVGDLSALLERMEGVTDPRSETQAVDATPAQDPQEVVGRPAPVVQGAAQKVPRRMCRKEDEGHPHERPQIP